MELEAAPKPVVAALHGNALGGGLETAMAAHYRIASPGTKIGQPEVKLGLIPGAGGTQRLPRLVGIEKAIEMCAYGDPITVEEASRFGLIDDIASADLLTAAIAFAKEVAFKPIPRTRDRIAKIGSAEATPGIFAAAREKADRTRKNLIAPLAAIDAVEAATMLPLEEGCRKEREIFDRLLVSDQAKALIHVFFAERTSAKLPGLSKDQATYPIASAAVIGAGTMGLGIAMCFANAALPVRLKDTRQDALDAAMAAIRSIYESSVAKGRLSAQEMNARLGRIQPQLDDRGFDQADIVVEAAFENMGVKQEIFSGLGGIAKPNAILATNTSYLNIDHIATSTAHPEMFLGLHFFSPANVMRLLEIVPGAVTSKQVLATAMALAKRLGKLGVVAGNCPGFIGNRMLRAFRREAQLMIEEGSRPKQVDTALEDFGMAMGPFAVQDLAGIDIAMSSRHIFAGLQRPGTRQPRVIEKLYEVGRYGQKTGAGWYLYDAKRTPQPDPAVDALVEQVATTAGIERREISTTEIIERTIFALIAEGARILEEKFARCASDIDMVFIHGYGFPAYRGGPMHYADSLGLKTVYGRIVEMQRIYGPAWEPAPLLKRLAEGNQSFSTWDAEREAQSAAN
jgi:3-hydroxyacyl-CoA dehydrogenase